MTRIKLLENEIIQLGPKVSHLVTLKSSPNDSQSPFLVTLPLAEAEDDVVRDLSIRLSVCLFVRSCVRWILVADVT